MKLEVNGFCGVVVVGNGAGRVWGMVPSGNARFAVQCERVIIGYEV